MEFQSIVPEAINSGTVSHRTHLSIERENTIKRRANPTSNVEEAKRNEGPEDRWNF